MRRGNGPGPLNGAIHMDELELYPGVRRTTYVVRTVCPSITMAAVRPTIRACEECLLIDPAPIHWDKKKAGGKRELTETRNGYHALWCPSFFDANRRWPVALFNLEAARETGLG